jgi:hypothetical protein
MDVCVSGINDIPSSKEEYSKETACPHTSLTSLPFHKNLNYSEAFKSGRSNYGERSSVWHKQ